MLQLFFHNLLIISRPLRSVQFITPYTHFLAAINTPNTTETRLLWYWCTTDRWCATDSYLIRRFLPFKLA
jgi:hypothetical protein